jgi:hypothetical protein
VFDGYYTDPIFKIDWPVYREIDCESPLAAMNWFKTWYNKKDQIPNIADELGPVDRYCTGDDCIDVLAPGA